LHNWLADAQIACRSRGYRTTFKLINMITGGSKRMDESLLSRSVSDFTNEVSRKTPVPGGGSVAALAGALGAALALMVTHLSIDKSDDESKNERLAAMTIRAEQLKDALLAAVDADTQAFAAYLAARRLPKSTPEEKALREEHIQAGLREAALVPLHTAELSLEAMRFAQEALLHGKPSAMTDAAVGMQMAFIGVQGGLWNTRINLKDIKDPAFHSEMETKCIELAANSRRLLKELDEEVDQRLR
jgi:glutamate formiminotransferase/formiminotetrahydrofolate cyclodeaminase